MTKTMEESNLGVSVMIKTMEENHLGASIMTNTLKEMCNKRYKGTK